MALLQYFPLAFLKGCCPFSSPAVTFLHLDPMIWDPSALSNRAASSSSTLFQSRWRYSIILFFFFFSSATLYLLVSSLALASTFLLAFWATCSAQRASAVFYSQRRDCSSSSCYCCISWCCFLSISASSCEMSKEVGKDIMIWKQSKKKNFLFCLCIVNLGTIMGFSDKPNRTSNQLNKTSKAQS